MDSFWELGKIGFPKMLEKNLYFSTKLDTESNLYPNLLKPNSRQLGLNYQLVEKSEDAAIEVIHELTISIVDCLDNKSYLKNL